MTLPRSLGLEIFNFRNLGKGFRKLGGPFSSLWFPIYHPHIVPSKSCQSGNEFMV